MLDASRKEWELYDLESDRTETNDLADRFHERVGRMKQAWLQWAKKVGVVKHRKKPIVPTYGFVLAFTSGTLFWQKSNGA